MPSHSESKGFTRGMILLGISLLVACLFEYLLFDKSLGIGFPLLILAMLAGGVAVTPKRRFDRSLLWVLVPLLFFSGMVFVRTSVLLTFLNVVASLLLLLLLLDLLTGKTLRDFVLRHYVRIVVLPLRFLRPLAITVSDILSLKGVYKNSKVVSQVLKGLLLAIPVLVFFGLLFASADLLFEKFISDLLTFDIDPEAVFMLIRIAIVTCAFLGGLSYLVSHVPKSPAAAPSANKDVSLGVIEVSIFLGAINLLFICFILIQLVYLFGGEGNVTAQGFTYAEYARKGFFELIVVAVASFLLLWKTEDLLPRKENLHHSPWFKAQSGILILQVLILMVSAFTRLSLYENAYGFTTLRLYSHAFILLISVIFLILLSKIFLDGKENIFAHRIFLAITAFLVCMNFLNPDAFIARKNIEYFTGEDSWKIDVDYLSTLSEDALPVTIDRIVAYKQGLAYDYLYELRNDFAPWQSTNIARMRAQKLLKDALPSL